MIDELTQGDHAPYVDVAPLGVAGYLGYLRWLIAKAATVGLPLFVAEAPHELPD